MKNLDLRQELRVNNVRHWQAADALGISEMTLVKWFRFELSEEKKALVRQAIKKVVETKN